MSGFVFFFFPPVVPADARSFALVFTGAQPSAGTCASVSGTSLPHETRDTYTDHLRPAAAASRHRAISCQCLSLRIRDSCLSCAVAPGCAQVAPRLRRVARQRIKPIHSGSGPWALEQAGRQRTAARQRPARSESKPAPSLTPNSVLSLSTCFPTYLLTYYGNRRADSLRRLARLVGRPLCRPGPVPSRPLTSRSSLVPLPLRLDRHTTLRYRRPP